jgi:hypothetical protein
MPIGDVIFQTVKIGELDLIKSNAFYQGIDIYEDINDPFGSPLIELNVIDPIDALNKYKITGSYDDNEVEIKFKYEPTGEIVKFTGKMYSNEYLMDRMGNRDEGSGHSKSYQIRAVQPEFFRSQGKSIEKSFSGPNTRHVEDIFKTISDKKIETLSPAEHRDKTFARVRPVDAVQSLIQEHSSPTYKSSAYTVFQQWKNGEPKIIQTTYEQLLEQEPVVTLRERTDLNSAGISELDQQNSVMFGQYNPSWSEPRALSKTVKKSFNHSTHQVVDQNYQEDTKTKNPAYEQPASYAGPVDYRTAEDTFNNSTPHTSSDAKRRRAQFLAHLSQGNATIEIPGNPKITLGSMINIEIPKKTDDLESGGEGQFNKKALVVAIRHKIKPAGQSPRYTMVLELVKGGMEQGGETA